MSRWLPPIQPLWTTPDLNSHHLCSQDKESRLRMGDIALLKEEAAKLDAEVKGLRKGRTPLPSSGVCAYVPAPCTATSPRMQKEGCSGPCKAG